MMALPQNGCQKFTFNNDYLIGAAPLPNNPDGGNKPGDSSPERCVSEADPAGFKLSPGSPARDTDTVIADNGGKDDAGAAVSETELPAGAMKNPSFCKSMINCDNWITDSGLLIGL
ncbi:TPA: hypothetical protein ACXE9F_003867 [Pluralibacter gergoviae]